eukprot:CAMPEP_0172457138 /NCGR_PEP_ID=MMETSP1065-20121228/20205_1 /TAXON_ID=265537 /ORGANISM="Amphiprora paludosa, Strain CCMP125" /LENGTH=185 /DNA_ID=CAMNT_0013210671 /DNA_START=100 /DNA_END=657 /DNA_ORIENTATION=+
MNSTNLTILVAVLAALGCPNADAFTVVPPSSSKSVSLKSAKNEVDVSDLGLTMEDLEAPLPAEFWQGVETSGYESSSRITGVQDDACFWTENQTGLKATLAIPGLRGQPAQALSVETASNTVSITAFGMVVWSCLLRGEVKPETAVFEANDGPDMVPVVECSVEKADTTERWGGFIEQIGENSIL